MPMYNLDANHSERVEDFKQCGCRVAELARSRSDVPGIPDLLVGIPNHPAGVYRLVLVEVKTDEGELSSAQEDFMAEWIDYPVHVIRTTEDVADLVRQYQATPRRQIGMISGPERRL